MSTIRNARTYARSGLLAVALTVLPSCGAGSALGAILGSDDVAVPASEPFSANIGLLGFGGTDAEHYLGDTVLNTSTTAVLSFPISPALEPAGYKVKSAQIVFNVVSLNNNAASVGPLVVDHVTTDLTGGSSAVAADNGDLPLAKTNGIGSVADVTTIGQRSVVVKDEFLVDWNTPGKTLTVFHLRMASVTADGGSDGLYIAGASNADALIRPRLIITFEPDI